jgi:uncharacterized protein YifE (UPF0438 family)
LPAQTLDWKNRSERLLGELHFALQRAPNQELALLLIAHPLKDFSLALARRGRNIVELTARLTSDLLSEVDIAIRATGQGKGVAYLRQGGERLRQVLEQAGSKIYGVTTRLANNPRDEALRIGAFALTALVASGGLDGDGGLPDTDIAIMGIDAHRAPLTHSIVAGAACETLLNCFIRLALHLHQHLPPHHDPVWDQFAGRSKDLLDAASRGVSVGLAYHLLIDGLAQPAAYHGLPLQMPMEVHQALQAANGLAEAADAAARVPLASKTAELVQMHRNLLGQSFPIVDEFAPWLSPEHRVILQQQGAWMAALSVGEVVPYTDDQVRFISVAWQLQPARAPAERAWVRLVYLVCVATSKELKTAIAAQKARAAHAAALDLVRRIKPFA